MDLLLPMQVQRQRALTTGEAAQLGLSPSQMDRSPFAQPVYDTPGASSNENPVQQVPYEEGVIKAKHYELSVALKRIQATKSRETVGCAEFQIHSDRTVNPEGEDQPDRPRLHKLLVDEECFRQNYATPGQKMVQMELAGTNQQFRLLPPVETFFKGEEAVQHIIRVLGLASKSVSVTSYTYNLPEMHRVLQALPPRGAVSYTHLTLPTKRIV